MARGDRPVSERTPTIEWQVAGACNYDCTYCIQSRRYRRGRPRIEQLDAALRFFAALPGQWEIKCSGGEAFAHPLFMAHIVPGLMARTSHRISVLSNFSASTHDLHRFAELTRGRLSVFSASFHIEYAQAAAFARKARWFSDLLESEARLVINQVVLPGREAEAAACQAVFEAEGLRWFPQLYKIKGGVAEYPDPDALRDLIGEAPGPREANTAPSYRGLRCWAGVEYLVVDKDGEAFSCRTAKRGGAGRLGNIFADDVTLWTAPSPCPYDICPCTVPANRGMIEGIGR
ncbi:MAG: MoaA/NifB/PqqE/SkfB family radical SAM enzyme [Myxococcota bacterium]|jgi:MoaA/NifB/PqqE/SkfB family radical SAM enzyme